MKFGILGAMESEVNLIISKLENSSVREISGFRYFEGIYNNKEIVVTECSIGKVNSAISTQIMIDYFKPDFIINTGIAGGLDDRLEILSMVIGEELTFHDFDHRILREYFPFREFFHADERAVTLAKKIASRENIHHISGRIITGDLFVEDSLKKIELMDKFGGLCVEMEGAAIANTAFVNNIPFIVLRSISDMADDGGKMTYDEFKVKASNQSATMVLNLVDEL